MDNEMKFGDYTVLESFTIVKYQIVLCESKSAPKDERYLCGYVESNALSSRLVDCLVSDTYADVALSVGERIMKAADDTLKIVEKIRDEIGDTTEITASDCESITMNDCIVNKVVVLNGDALRPDFRNAAYQLLLCKGGFGAQENARGRSCICTRLYDNLSTSCNRDEIIGIMPYDKLPEWAQEKLAEITKEGK